MLFFKIENGDPWKCFTDLINLKLYLTLFKMISGRFCHQIDNNSNI